MAETYYPFDAGSGASVAENQWGEMAQFWMGTGVIRNQLNNLNVFADSTGMQVKGDTGKAYIKGYFYKNDALKVLAIAAANATNPRIDRVILRVDWTANTITMLVLTGVAAASPTPPALTQSASVWEISLCQVRVDAGVSTIAANKITDERVLAGISPYFYTNQGSQTSYPTANGLQRLAINSGITIFAGCTIGSDEIVFPKGGTFYFEGRVALSGLNNLQNAELLIRCYQADGVTFSDDSLQILGYQGLGSNYTQSIPISNYRMFNIPDGGKVQFFIRVSEAPRTLNSYRVSGFRVGD
jgi:hypothetical protein